MRADTPFLELCGVQKRYGEVVALHDCNLAIEKGEFITLLGPSGCGKTTTLRLIAGFLKPDAGELRLDGKLLSSARVHTPPEERNMGMVFQSFAVWPHLSVYENVALPLRIRRRSAGEIEQACKEMFRLCRLEGLAERSPHELSGGQLQRVALARALVYQPRLVLLDEPLSNLDAALREEVRRELHKIHKAIGATFFLVTHDQVEAMSLSDRVVVMSHGRIEQIGSPQEIYHSPATEFVAQFVGAANLVKGRITELEGGAERLCRVHLPGLELLAKGGRGWTTGSDCTVALAPEDLRLGSPDASAKGPNHFLGEVREAYFLGRTQEVVIGVGQLELRVNETRGNSFRPGDRVSVNVTPAAVVLL